MVVSNPVQAATSQLRAFCTEDSNGMLQRAIGNPCRVTLFESAPPSLPERPAQSGAVASIPQCSSWPLEDRRAGVACWTADGTPIRICGHGLMTCAALWMERWGEGGILVMNGAEIACRASNGCIWLGFEPLETEPCEVPDWCQEYFPEEPVAAALAGGEDGYLVLQWPDDFRLGDLATPPPSLVRRTRRALIVTCAVGPGSAVLGEQIRYRYFAPQHGVSEDPATGSAMRVLAHHWMRLGFGCELTAFQDSASGGLLFSSIKSGVTWIGGRTARVTGSESLD